MVLKMINLLTLMQDVTRSFGVCFSDLDESIVIKLLNTSNKHGVLSVAPYFRYLELTKFDLLRAVNDYMLKKLRDVNTTKDSGIDSLPGRFFRGW